MERVIDKRLSTSIIILTSLWMMVSCVYNLSDRLPFSEAFWWALEKVNDRIYMIGLLSIASLAFTDIRIKLFSIAAIIYVVFRCYLELIYISNPYENTDVMFSIAGLYCICVFIIMLIFTYVRSSR